MIDVKKCSKCSELKPLSEFFKKKNGKFGRQSVCKICMKEYDPTGESTRARSRAHYEANRELTLEKQKAYRASNAERIALYQSQYYLAHPGISREKYAKRRALEIDAMGDLPCNWVYVLLSYYGSSCLSCGSQENLEMDHVVPLSRGGMHDLSNMQILCRTCNRSKGNRNSNDYRTKILIGRVVT
jgi:5-methylcytosine-specific restriction endonuclease McrA